MNLDTGAKYKAPALEKGLDILETLAHEEVGLTQKEIAARIGRSVNEIFRMLSVLVRRRYVELRPDSDLYTLTTRMFELAHRHPPMKQLISEALPLMRQAAERTKQSCHLTIFHEGALLAVAQVDSPEPLGYHVHAGARFEFLETSSAHVLLAFTTAQERERMLAALPGKERENLDSAALRDRLLMIRRTGYEERDSAVIRGVLNIAFPVFGFSGHAVAALTLPYLFKIAGKSQPPVSKARAAAADVARKLSKAIGAPDDVEAMWSDVRDLEPL